MSKQELRDLVAPVALYPDVVLSSLLPATTNPDQLHDAAQYVGDAQHVETIPQDRGWDGSVIGLLQFPDVLRWLDQNPAWTDQMGQAVTYQQGDVLEAIQDYRHAVQKVGNLKSNQYQKVFGAANEDIRIEPARPEVVYVPSYDPVLATQPQPVQESPGINPWLAFGGGAVVGALGAWALYSIFDNDDHDHHYNNYYGGRRIRAYNNYYYARGRRPAAVEWTPRPRPRRAVPQGWQHPRRLDYRGEPVQAGKKRGPALRPPMMTSAQQPPKPGELRREQQQQRREQKQENRQERQTQRQERTQQQRDQRQERKQAQQQQRQMKQEQQGQRRQQRQDQRQEQGQQRQENQQEKRQQQQQNQQEKRQQQQQNRQEQRQQRQEQQQQRQEQRQERQQERKGQRQEHQEQNQQHKKKKQQQQ